MNTEMNLKHSKFLACLVLAMSVYTLILFIIVQFLQWQTANPVVTVIVVVTPSATTAPKYYEPTPTPSNNPPTMHHNTPQKGGYTGTETAPYTAPVVPVHYVVRSTVKHVILSKPRPYVYHHRHYEKHHRNAEKHHHHHRKHHKKTLDKC